MKRWWLSLFCLMIGSLVATCSVVVDPSSLVIKCEIPIGGTEDPCLGAGMHCVQSECKPCEGETETCNGFDDDCDGVIDNGHDTDGDGFTWCGGGRAEYADCAPNDPAIHPAGPMGPDSMFVTAPDEICDAKDNDCDSKVDEDDSKAAGTEKCAPPEDMTCVKLGCPENQRCDATTGVCADRLPTGSGCQTDAECAGGFCIRKGSYNLGVELADNRCATACCGDLDCAAGSLCVASDVGVRVCLPSNIAARGARADAAQCTRNADCSSGSCVSGRCVTRCTTDEVCDADSMCALSAGAWDEGRRWLCGQPQGSEADGESCRLSTCRSGYCRNSACASVCGRNADCEADEACNYTAVRPLLLGPTTIVSVCMPRAEVASGTLCCTNTDCNTGQLCAPYAVTEGGQWTMLCR